MMANSSNKPDTGTWNSIDDALETFYSFSRVTKGSGPKSGDVSMSNQSAGRNDGIQLDSLQSENNNTSEERANENSFYTGGGRGKFIKNLQDRFSRQELDESIHNELRQLFGPGFSNEVIENHFASVCSSSSESSTPETRVFPVPYSRGNVQDVHFRQQEIDFVVGESSIMKKIAANEKLSAKKKSPRCRNALVLSLTQNKSSNDSETEQDAKKVPELKGPDLFLPNKSYSTVVSAASSSSCNKDDGPSFNEEDFPAL